MLHKINCLHKPPRLVDFSLQLKEGKYEKNLDDLDYFVGYDSLYRAAGQNT